MDDNLLNSIRADIERDLLPSTCDILTPTRTADGYGGWTTTMGTAYASVKCRLDPLSGREAAAAGAVQPFHGYRLTLPHDAVLTTEGQVRISGVTYNVISVDSVKSWAASVRALVERVP